jgi:hypothetical protein
MKPISERIAEVVVALVFMFAVVYFSGHVVAAWLRGAFQMVSK